MGMKLPPWLSEGMAELYSTLKPMGEKVLVGTLIEGRHQALLNEKWVPLKIIVNADFASPYYNERNQAGSLYNEGWALTHMLVLTNAYRPGICGRFLELINAGTPTEEALNKVYGKSIEQVDKELQAYLRGTHFQGAYFAQKVEQISDEVKVEPADPSGVGWKMALLDLLDRPGKESEMRAALEQLTREEPRRPEPFVALGYMAGRAGENEEAVKDFGKAFELGGRDPAMLWDYGRMLRGRDQTEAIHVLGELVALEPARLDVRMELAAHQLTAKKAAEALDTLKPVKDVAPEDAARFYAIMAHAQLDTRQFDAAKDSAEKLKKAARSDEDTFQADRILKFLEARANGGAPVSSLEPGRPVLRRKEADSVSEVASQEKSVAGSFVLFDCSGKSPKVILETESGTKTFLIDDPGKIAGRRMDLSCGPQNKDRIRIDYILGNEAGVDGWVRGMRVEP